MSPLPGIALPNDPRMLISSAGGRNVMKIIAYVLAVICVIAAILYYVLPGGSLPTFMPGYEAGSTHVHILHGFAAVTGAIVFLLIGLSAKPRH
jgi:hypothetical protein